MRKTEAQRTSCWRGIASNPQSEHSKPGLWLCSQLLPAHLSPVSRGPWFCSPTAISKDWCQHKVGQWGTGASMEGTQFTECHHPTMFSSCSLRPGGDGHSLIAGGRLRSGDERVTPPQAHPAEKQWTHSPRQGLPTPNRVISLVLASLFHRNHASYHLVGACNTPVLAGVLLLLPCFLECSVR